MTLCTRFDLTTVTFSSATVLTTINRYNSWTSKYNTVPDGSTSLAANTAKEKEGGKDSPANSRRENDAKAGGGAVVTLGVIRARWSVISARRRRKVADSLPRFPPLELSLPKHGFACCVAPSLPLSSPLFPFPETVVRTPPPRRKTSLSSFFFFLFFFILWEGKNTAFQKRRWVMEERLSYECYRADFMVDALFVYLCKAAAAAQTLQVL